MHRPPARESTPAPEPRNTNSEDDSAAPGFGAALEAFEREHPPAAQASDDAKPEARTRERAARKVGDRVRARLVAIQADVLLFDVGGRSEAVADAREFRNESGELSLAVGDRIELHVVEAGEPLTLARAAPRRGRRSVAAMRQARESGLPVRGRVTAVNPGGLTVDVDGVRAFCPHSQIDEQHVADAAPYVGRTLEFLVGEVDEARARVIVSRRRLLMRQRAEAARERLAALAPGQEMDGVVARIEAYGAFVDLGGIEGLVHVSEISHHRIAHPKDGVAVGDAVRVRVLEVAQGKGERRRVSLSIRALAPDPWVTAAANFAVGARVQGVVVRLADFGAFVNLAPGIDGLVHVSQVSDRRIGHAREVLSPGQAVEAVVLAVEPERRRISLSIREAIVSDPGASRVIESQPQPATERGAGEPGPRARRDRGDRGDRRDRGDRGDRGGRGPRRRERGREQDGSRDPARTEPVREQSARPSEPPALTVMQLAFQRARERQKERERNG